MNNSDRKPLAEMSNAELRKEVAEWLGFRIELRDGAWRLFGTNGEQFFDDEGYVVQIDQSTQSFMNFIEAQAFDWLIIKEGVPDWPDDLNAAADDCLSKIDCGLYYSDIKHQWYLLDRDEFDFAYHASPARAVCEAYCEMMRKENDHE